MNQKDDDMFKDIDGLSEEQRSSLQFLMSLSDEKSFSDWANEVGLEEVENGLALLEVALMDMMETIDQEEEIFETSKKMTEDLLSKFVVAKN